MSTFELADGTGPAPTDRSYWVVRDLLAAGAYPGKSDSAAPDRDLTALFAAGIGSIVNLTKDNIPGSTDYFLNEYDDDAIRLLPDVRVVRMPIQDVSVPSRDEMVAILDEIDGFLSSDVGTYIHCWGGLGRTGIVVGCWLIRHGFETPETVLAAISVLRRQDRLAGHRRSPETDGQDRFVLAWEHGT